MGKLAGDLLLAGVKVCLTIHSPNIVHTFCLEQVGRIYMRYLGLKVSVLVIGLITPDHRWVEKKTTDHLPGFVATTVVYAIKPRVIRKQLGE